MYRNILVPIALDLDHDPAQALEAAKVLADQNGSVTLLHVFDIVPAYVASQIPEGVRDKARDMMVKQLEAMSEKLPNAKVATGDGPAGSEIVDYAEKHEIDLIIIASHRPGLQDYFLGSTASRVVRHAHCAVHVTR